jgi:hypothetical protein
MTRAGIFGISLSGKTTLAKQISLQYFKKNKIESLVLDPHEEVYGEHAKVFSDEELFWQAVWVEGEPKLIIVDEAAATIRRERDLVPVFTRLRHLKHKLIVVGHNGTDLLPVMRQQFDTLYLFRQPFKAAEIWADLFSNDGLLEAANLNQYEFIYCQLYNLCRKLKLTI